MLNKLNTAIALLKLTVTAIPKLKNVWQQYKINKKQNKLDKQAIKPYSMDRALALGDAYQLANMPPKSTLIRG